MENGETRQEGARQETINNEEESTETRTSLPNKKNTILIFVGVLILLGAYLSITVLPKEKDKGTKATTTAITATSSKGTLRTEGTGSYTIEQVPVARTSSIPQSAMPPLSKPLTITSSVLPDAAKTILTNNYNTLIANLKKDSTSFQDWADLSVVYKTAGDYKSAETIWNYMALAWPTSYVPFADLADLYAHYLPDYVKSEANYKKAIAIDPSFEGGYRGLSELYRYLYKEKASMAPDVLKQGASANPKNPDYSLLLAEYYKDMGDTQTAKTYYTQALTLAQTLSNTALTASIQNEMQGVQ